LPPSKLATYHIGTVARLTGLSEHLIRVWERRYGAVQPHRTGSGLRLYSEAEVTRLRWLKRAADRGHAISGIAALDGGQLERLGGDATAEIRGGASPEVATSQPVEELVRAVGSFDMAGAQDIIGRANVSFGPRATAVGVLIPVLREVGRGWQEGRLSVAQEHAAASVMRDYLGSVMRTLGRLERGPLAVSTTPPGDLHEFGALVAAVYAASVGVRVAYLGPNLPVPELVRAVLTLRAQAVLLSAVARRRRLDAFLAQLRAELPARARIVLGGAAAGQLQQVPAGVLRLERIEQLDPVLAELVERTARAPGRLERTARNKSTKNL
jgi:DNA-binding transcriptional MerR regulator/methylmalonyl-CoA mutase cobalamin-binding subunit